jgi:hypothetical protein
MLKTHPAVAAGSVKTRATLTGRAKLAMVITARDCARALPRDPAMKTGRGRGPIGQNMSLRKKALLPGFFLADAG